MAGLGLGTVAIGCVMWRNPVASRLFANTLFLAIAAVCLAWPVGVLASWILIRRADRWAMAIFGLLVLMGLIPPYLHAAAWEAVAGASGIVPLDWGGPVLLRGWPAAIWLHAITAILGVLLLSAWGWRSVPRELEDLASLDATPRRVWWQVTLPLASPALVAAAAWIAVSVATEMTVTDLFRIRTFAEEFYTAVAATGTLQGGAWSIWPMVAFLGLVTAVALWLASTLAPHCRWTGLFAQRSREPAGKSAGVGVFLGLLVMCLVIVPVLGLIRKAGLVVTRLDDGWSRGWELRKAVEMVWSSPVDFHRELLWSGILGILVATGGMLLAWAIAWPARRGGKWAAFALGSSALALAVPGPVWAMGLLEAFSYPLPLLSYLRDRTLLVPVLALCIKTLPWAVLVMWHGSRRVPEELWELSRLEGATFWERWWHVGLPWLRVPLAMTWLIGFCLAVGDLGASLVLLPPGVMTLAARIFDRLHTGADAQVAGVCLFQMGLFWLLGGLVVTCATRFNRLR